MNQGTPAGEKPERRIIVELRRLCAERARREVEVEKARRLAAAVAQRELERAAAAAREDFERASAELQGTYEGKKGDAGRMFEADQGRATREYERDKGETVVRLDSQEGAARKALHNTIWAADTIYEANQGKPGAEYEQTKKELRARASDLSVLEGEASRLLARYGDAALPAAGQGQSGGEGHLGEAPAADVQASLGAAHAALVVLDRMTLPKVVRRAWPVVIAVMIGLGAAAGAAGAEQWKLGPHAAIVGVGGAALGGVMMWALRRASRAKVAGVRSRLVELVGIAHRALDAALSEAAAKRDRLSAALKDKRDSEVRAAKEKYTPAITGARQEKEHTLRELAAKYSRRVSEIERARDDEIGAAERERGALLESAQRALDLATSGAQRGYAEAMELANTRHQAEWSALAREWKSGMQGAYSAADAVIQVSARASPPWDSPAWEGWAPPREGAGGVRFGSLHVDLAGFEGGLPTDPGLIVPGPAGFELPVSLWLSEGASLLVKHGATGGGRSEAISALQAVMLRILTALPPGKARFTVIDPIGLGENFAGFMHLADYDDALVTGKIWTEARHIEQRLADLTEHMENVIQKYLRNEFRTIAEYNLQAGEIAEPYRFLVIADFPVGFSDTAAKRLSSIITSGARCGVYTLIAMDTRQPMPPGTPRADIERNSTILSWKAGGDNGAKGPGRFVYDDPDFAALPLTVEAPPSDEQLTRIVHQVGGAAKDSRRVQVPFDVVAPSLAETWSRDASLDVRVPLGRAGATKLQSLTLGRGTSQHALVAGKTGSGKSTLLHALITSVALWYSPDEVELYLVDFKKGVEFKTYATHDLPHARAVAVESDREFGLSVLQRLDSELKRRANLYRDLGVQDLDGFRRAVASGRGGELVASRNGRGPAMPRILLVIDEFQEFFTEDDKVAQEAALLLDRLVRQGRAFGVHVLLGSQTLSGAYSLARSTMGQMAVRIALQCSEADSYLILGEDNSAARLLSRPGEAIYNDAGGLVEANSPFQVVWLPDEQRERFLGQVAAAAAARGFERDEPQAVFEGNAPADIARNRPLAELLAARAGGGVSVPATTRAWLGEPISIKDPTSVAFRRHSGGNLLVVGQREETALAMLASSLLSLIAQHPPGAAQFAFLDATPPDSALSGEPERLIGSLTEDRGSGRAEVRLAGVRDAAAVLGELAAELGRRQQDERPAGARFLFINGLHRFRALKRKEDDFGFSASEGPLTPDKHLAAILRDGPAVGIHTILWCDTVANLNRALERQALREFDSRVLMQMSGADSGALIDAPDASKLGLHRAMLYNEEHGLVEKFRPNSMPTERWLTAALSGRSPGPVTPAVTGQA